MFETRLTKLLGIKYPIVGGAMLTISRAELVAAISNAGGLGLLSALTAYTEQELRDEIRRTRDLTDKPFGANIALMPFQRPMTVEQYIDVIIDEGVPILETAANSPKAYVDRIKRSGVTFLHKCARVRDAKSAERLGAAAISIVGCECGGHPGHDDISTTVLVPMTVDAVSIPVIAGGGFADGRGLAAALALGADGVVMGTRFMATRECPLHEAVKEWMLAASEADTTVIQRTIGSNMRVGKTSPALKVIDMESRKAPFDDLFTVIAGPRGREVMLEGKLDAGVFACGEVVGLIKDVPTVKETIDAIIAQADAIRQRLIALN